MSFKSQNKGALYVVGTPIGNLKDISVRAKEVLGEVSLVAAEDTRSTRKLLTHLGIKAGLLSCHKHNERTSAEKVITLLAEGKDVAMVSDAGTPALSDPGAGLVKLVRDAGFSIVPVPGASAVVAALSVAAMTADSFFFAGFLPSKQAERRKTLEKLAEIPHTIVIFEAPHRLLDALEDILGVLGNRQMVMARELTKLHETVISGSVSGILKQLSKGRVRGEITLVIEWADKDRHRKSCRDPEAVEKALQYLISEKSLSARDSVDLLVRLTGMTKSQVYPLALEIKQKDSMGNHMNLPNHQITKSLNHQIKVFAIIPARFGSSRFPGKPLAKIQGSPMILHVYQRALKVPGIDQVVVATDDSRIAECVKAAGGTVFMTDPGHPSGTDRIAEVARLLELSDNDVVVNIQGDQPLLDSQPVVAIIKMLLEVPDFAMTTPACPLEAREALNPNRVKVVVDNNQKALYFSRAMIPYYRDANTVGDLPKGSGQYYLRHLGLYAYRQNFLQTFVTLPPGKLEQIERLEQLRALENGYSVGVVRVEEAPLEVDTPEDLDAVCSSLAGQ
ncbi:MAG: hypothetical protein C4B58_08700 [Deltaproteobacteria bacterium]|nr:MAG: hypothetical protein C4B58_08700 [Deltaproteobacteria bacterium]